MSDLPLKNPSKLLERLGLENTRHLLLVDAPNSLKKLLAVGRSEEETRSVDGRAIRSIKQTFDSILLWREDRVGSRFVLDNAVKRLEPGGGSLWVVTAMKKVTGPRTPAVRRLELADLTKAFARQGLQHDREVRISAWHVAYRFTKG